MTDLTIRPPREDELDAVGELTVRAYRADGYFDAGGLAGYERELADAAARSRGAELLVAADPAGRLLGTVTIVHPDTPLAEVCRPGELEFRMLAVDPDARGRGIGAALIQAVLTRARELAVSRVVLSSQPRMTGVHRLYERLGFRRLPNRDWRPTPTAPLIAFALDL